MKQYTLQFDPREKYLYANVNSKEDNYEISKAFWQEIIAKAKELNYDKILVHENISETIDLDEIYQVIVELRLELANLKVAFVDDMLDQDFINQMGLYVAKNAGINGNIFQSDKLAEEWLLAP